jgi:pyrroloquinoline quinone (PQQ) biosynthesis protein C
MQPFDRLKVETQASQSYLFAAPILEDVAAGRFDLDTYVRFLRNAYHHVRHTVPLMMACGSRLPERLRWLHGSLKDYIVEEIGHEQWILDDLAACGVDPDDVAASEPNFETDLLVSYVYDYIERRNPVGFLGMVHVLEGTSTAIATETARLVQSRLGLPDGAFHYLRSHGELDIEHVAFFENLINRLTARDDVDAIIHVANRVFYLYGDVIRSAAGEGLRHAA